MKTQEASKVGCLKMKDHGLNEFVLLASWVSLKRSRYILVKGLNIKRAHANEAVISRKVTSSDLQGDPHCVHITRFSNVLVTQNTILCVHSFQKEPIPLNPTLSSLERLDREHAKDPQKYAPLNRQSYVLAATWMKYFPSGFDKLHCLDVERPCKQFMTSHITEYNFSQTEHDAVFLASGWKGANQNKTKLAYNLPKRVLIYSSSCNFPHFVSADGHNDQKLIRTGDAKLFAGLPENPSIASHGVCTDGHRYFAHITQEKQVIVYDLLKILRSYLNYSSHEPVYMDPPDQSVLHSVTMSNTGELWMINTSSDLYELTGHQDTLWEFSQANARRQTKPPSSRLVCKDLRQHVSHVLQSEHPQTQDWEISPCSVQAVLVPCTKQFKFDQIQNNKQTGDGVTEPKQVDLSKTNNMTSDSSQLLCSFNCTHPSEQNHSAYVLIKNMSRASPTVKRILTCRAEQDERQTSPGTVYKNPRVFSLIPLSHHPQPCAVPVLCLYTHSVFDVLCVGKSLSFIAKRVVLHNPHENRAQKNLLLTNGGLGGWAGFANYWAMIYGMNFIYGVNLSLRPCHLLA